MVRKISPKKYTELASGVRLSAHEKVCAERMKSLLSSIERLEKKVEFLEKVKVDLDVRQSAGKAQLRELAQVIVDIATTKLELINLEAQKTQATIDFLLLTQNLHSTLLDDEDLKEILKIENGN